jgi:hypothetical protein
MTVKTMERKVEALERRVRTLEKEQSVPAHPVSRKTEIQETLRAVSGLWASRPRTKADLKRVRSQLGLA